MSDEVPRVGQQCWVVDGPVISTMWYTGHQPVTHPNGKQGSTDGWGRYGSMHERIDLWAPVPDMKMKRCDGGSVPDNGPEETPVQFLVDDAYKQSVITHWDSMFCLYKGSNGWVLSLDDGTCEDIGPVDLMILAYELAARNDKLETA